MWFCGNLWSIEGKIQHALDLKGVKGNSLLPYKDRFLTSVSFLKCLAKLPMYKTAYTGLVKKYM